MVRQLRPQPADGALSPDAALPGDLAREFAAVAAGKTARPPKWIAPNELPGITLHDGSALATDRIQLLLTALSINEPLKETPLVAALRRHADPASLDCFASELFETWRRAGMNSKAWWALGAVGLLGGEPAGLRLVPYVRSWPGKSRYQAARLGYDCLRRIATPAILWNVLRAARTSTNAKEFFSQSATDQGLSPEQLEDRVIPTCGFDARGERFFDFGPRQFTVKLGPNLQPIVIEPGGKRKGQLPKPTGKDDPAKGASALEAWTTFKKDLADVVTSQSKRLEEAFHKGIAWLPEDLTTYLVPHPESGP